MFSPFLREKLSTRILIEVKRLMTELVSKVNISFEKIKKNEEVLATHIRAVQSGLDKFKNEIGNNGVFLRLKALENTTSTYSLAARLEALEDYLKIRVVKNTEQKAVEVAGLHYEKKSMKKKRNSDYYEDEVPF